LRFAFRLWGADVQFLLADHTLDTEHRELRRGSEPVEPQMFDLLVCLRQNRDRVVSRNDLIASV
jgi:DNA-binding winged helix-turn-helix (wHTH) protein